MLIFGALGSGALMFAYLAAIAGGSYIFIVGIAMSGLVYSAQNGIWPTPAPRTPPTRPASVRTSTPSGTRRSKATGGVSARQPSGQQLTR